MARLSFGRGALLGGNFLMAAPADGQDEAGGWAAYDGTNFLVPLQYNASTSSNHNVTYGMFISPSGGVGTPLAIGQTVSPNRNFAGVVFNGTNYLVVWTFDSETGGSDNPVWNIYGRFVTPSGSFAGNEFVIVSNANLILPVPAFDGANYLLSWNVNFGATNSNVQCQFLNGSGRPMGPQFAPFSAQGSQAPLFTAPIYDGKRFVAVTALSADGLQPASNAGIYGAFIPASTAPPQFGAGTFWGSQQCWLSLAGTPGINYAIQMAAESGHPQLDRVGHQLPDQWPVHLHRPRRHQRQPLLPGGETVTTRGACAAGVC